MNDQIIIFRIIILTAAIMASPDAAHSVGGVDEISVSTFKAAEQTLLHMLFIYEKQSYAFDAVGRVRRREEIHIDAVGDVSRVQVRLGEGSPVEEDDVVGPAALRGRCAGACPLVYGAPPTTAGSAAVPFNDVDRCAARLVKTVRGARARVQARCLCE